MFGKDSKGIALARRIFRRSNSERKRPGAVILMLNENFLRSNEIQVFEDGFRVPAESLASFCHRLRAEVSKVTGTVDDTLGQRNYLMPASFNTMNM